MKKRSDKMIRKEGMITRMGMVFIFFSIWELCLGFITRLCLIFSPLIPFIINIKLKLLISILLFVIGFLITRWQVIRDYYLTFKFLGLSLSLFILSFGIYLLLFQILPGIFLSQYSNLEIWLIISLWFIIVGFFLLNKSIKDSGLNNELMDALKNIFNNLFK
jgi:hypothetical protein